MVNFIKDIMIKVYMNYDFDFCIKVILNLIEWLNWLLRLGVKDKVIIKIVSFDFFYLIGFWLNILYLDY